MDRTQHTAKIFDNCADEYQEKFMDIGLYHDSLSLFCQKIEKTNARILDAACGPGNITKFLLSRRPDFEVLGIDLSRKMIDLAKLNNPNTEFKVMDCRTMAEQNQKFDGIICGFGLPYLSQEEAIRFIEDSSKILTEKGLLYISTMEDNYKLSRFVTPSSGDKNAALYTNYHEADYLLKALNDSGFEIVDVSRKIFKYENGNTNNDLIIISQLNK